MQFQQSLSISEISPKYLAGLFSCHKKLAKQMCEDIEKTPKDSIAYKKENSSNGELKV